MGKGRGRGHGGAALPKSSLGRSLMRDQRRRRVIDGGREVHASGSSATSEHSVTQRGDLSEFMAAVELSNRSFEGTRGPQKIVPTGPVAVLSRSQVLPPDLRPRELAAARQQWGARVTVPRRPQWTAAMTPAELYQRETESFLEWRRGLAALEETEEVLLTPFERNPEVWKMLWRCIERSDLVVQIVDARNPLLFRCDDLEEYARTDVRFTRTRLPGVQDAGLGASSALANLEAQASGGEAQIQRIRRTQRKNLLLVNKADFLTPAERLKWARYFVAQGIEFAFFSALQSSAEREDPDFEGPEGIDEVEVRGSKQFADEKETRAGGLAEDDSGSSKHVVSDVEAVSECDFAGRSEPEMVVSGPSDSVMDIEVRKSSILGCIELVELFELLIGSGEDGGTARESAVRDSVVTHDAAEEGDHEEKGVGGGPNLQGSGGSGSDSERDSGDGEEIEASKQTSSTEDQEQEQEQERAWVVGMIGYPNVGKSSTINALLGAKRVAVSQTPGRTKHLQTLVIGPRLVLCDCPGLVFPSLASSREEMLISGVLPIDTMREFRSALELICARVPRATLEAAYGLQLAEAPEGRRGPALVEAYAAARGYKTGGSDAARCARIIIKDFVKGRILAVSEPPLFESDAVVESSSETRSARLSPRLPQPTYEDPDQLAQMERFDSDVQAHVAGAGHRKARRAAARHGRTVQGDSYVRHNAVPRGADGAGRGGE